jgi:cell division protein FtsB
MKFRTILLGLAGLFVAGNAAYFSIMGLSKLFAGASSSIILMASSLELAKLIAASYLYNYWDTINKVMRTYYFIAITTLILITSVGIYGFLTSAYQQTAEEISVLDKRVEIVDVKKTRYKEQLDAYNVEKTQLNQSIQDLSLGLTNNVIQYKDRETGEIITTTSSATRRALTEQLNDSKSQRDIITEKSQVLNDSITKWDLDILTLKTETEIGGEIGPLKYLAEITGLPMNMIVNILTLFIIFVFDPLAVTLIVAFNSAMKVDKGEKDKKDKKRTMKTLEVYGEKGDREKYLQQMVKDAEDMGLYDEPILKSERDKEIFFNELQNPTPPNDTLKEAAKNYKDIVVNGTEEIKPDDIEDDFTPKDLDGDGVISEDEKRIAYENGGWRNPAPNGANYYTHPWFDWKKSERWINDSNAVDYWKKHWAGTQRALEQYRNNYPTDFTSKTY